MSAFRRTLALALICIAAGAVAHAQRAEDAAAQILGPRWRQLARDSGMIFAGTVLEVRTPPAGGEQAIPTVEIKIRVERAIVGVRSSQIVRIREWAPAWSLYPLVVGQRLLLLLYPPSRLGLTSPVGGSLGQIAVRGNHLVLSPGTISGDEDRSQLRELPQPDSGAEISLTQLARALRSARVAGPVRPRSGGIRREE